MTESQTTNTAHGLNGDLQDRENDSRGTSDDEDYERTCGDTDRDHSSLNRCQDQDDIRSPSPGDHRRGSCTEAGLPSGKRVPPRPWPPTSPSHQATVPSKPLVRRGSLKGKAWPPPGYTEPNSAQTSLASDGKGRKGPPRQWPPPAKPGSNSPPPLSPTLALISDGIGGDSTHDHSYATDSQKDESVVQSGDPDALNSCHDWEEDEEDGSTNKESLSESYPSRGTGTPFTMSPSPPATPEPKTDPSPSPTGSFAEDSPALSSSPRSASPVSQHENNKS